MVFSNRFVMCVLVNGVPQKELANGQVNLPDGTEYSLRFRNKNNRRALAQITIDGENVSDGGFIVEANSYVDIQRPTSVDKAFKIVSLQSPDAIDFGKDTANKDKTMGVIEAKFYLEKQKPKVEVKEVHHYYHHHNPYNQPWFAPCGANRPTTTCRIDDVLRSNSRSRTIKSSSSLTTSDCHAPDQVLSFNASSEIQEACTVEGEATGQSFRSVYFDAETDFVTLKLFLCCFTPEVNVVSDKPRKSRKTNVEIENEKLRERIAELENQQLKEKLSQLES